MKFSSIPCASPCVAIIPAQVFAPRHLVYEITKQEWHQGPLSRSSGVLLFRAQRAVAIQIDRLILYRSPRFSHEI
jgi:hypothetical protein